MTSEPSYGATSGSNRPVTLFPQIPIEPSISEETLEQQTKSAYRLKFTRENERRFQVFYGKTSLFFSQATLSVGIVGYILFGLTDYLNLPINYPKAWMIRYLLICPLYIGILGLSFQKKWVKAIPNFTGITHVLGATGLMAIMAIADPSEAGHRMFLGLVPVILAIHFSRLPFMKATLLGWILLLIYVGLRIFKISTLQPTVEVSAFIGNFLFLCFMNMVGMSISYMLEASARVEFLQRRALAYEKQRSESLLFSILPQKIAKRLVHNRGIIAQEYPMASILFADIVNFTPLSERLTPAELVSLLNDLFSEFDRLANLHGVEKIKTIGDCYMAATGVPTPDGNHAQKITAMAIDMVKFIHQFDDRYHYSINLRIGIHSGTVVAGVIGQQKPMYDLWGDTVNTASRMESHGQVGKIQISRETYELLDDRFLCEPQGAIEVKGKGRLEVWHVIEKGNQDEIRRMKSDG